MARFYLAEVVTELATELATEAAADAGPDGAFTMKALFKVW